MFDYSTQEEDEVAPKYLIISIIANALLVIFGLIGLILSIFDHGKAMFKFYTINSNILSMIFSGIYLVFALNRKFNKKTIPKIIFVLKLIGATTVCVTFFVATCVLTPKLKDPYAIFIKGHTIFYHLLCPLITNISFIFFDSAIELNWIDGIYSDILTLIYGAILIPLSSTQTIEAPYPFFDINQLNWKIVVLINTGIVIFTYLFSYLLIIFSNKFLAKKKIDYNNKLLSDLGTDNRVTL